jgi:ATP-dependent exoDNAse (exonuclease V) beta subunit
MSKVVDQAVRDELLTPYKSYIVQAPAGSGKTELLTQRILALLAVVDKPENILAITFTRKAAAEMKSRVVSALQLAKQQEPEASHEKHRWQLAQKVLNKDKENEWRLLENSGRLNITTIDSLSASLSSALPLLSQTGALPKIAENALQYYQEAADNCLNSISDGDQTAENIKCLLKHKDNNLSQVSELLAQMLAKRLQWFAQIKSHAREFDENQLARSLKIVITEKIQECYMAIPHNITNELAALLNQASSILVNNDKVNKPYLQNLSNVSAIGLPEYEDLIIWKAISELLLKSGNKPELLSSFTIRSGFPTPKDAVDEAQKIQFKHNKKLITDIAAELSQMPEVCDLLLQIKLLPDEIDESVSQLSLKAAVSLLPVAVAHLKLVFSRYNVVDFPELSLASLEALGHPEMPTDLALALDYKLEHILIDEFQDTSTPQIELIKMLTAAWEVDSARTLFLVGDPMQSIYRFRDANVSLFMQICEQGIGHIHPEFKQLKVNFRSSETIVNWVNQQFERIMPNVDNVTFSAVSYAHSVAFNPSDDTSEVASVLTIDAVDNAAQAQHIIELVKRHLKNNMGESKKKKLAILARSRNNFSEIIQLLNQNNIVFQAVEIDRLSQKMIVKDLASLAFALSDLFDELSWAACMRSPWFGLSLEAIRHVMVNTEKCFSFPVRIQQAIELMDESSQQRCQKILPILKMSVSFKGRKPFKKWLFGCFKAVGGLSQLDFDSDLDDLFVCLDKLSEVCEGGELNDRQLVFDAIDRLFAAVNPHADEQVQVMTIHKSKGLEFDTVILPRLDSGKRVGDTALLKWTEVLDNSGEPHNLLAISKEVGKENNSVYDYISFLDKEKSKFEDQRVLYVAATRAKDQLYLLGDIKSDPKLDSEYKLPNSASFLSMIWPGIKDSFEPINSSLAQPPVIIENASQSLYQSRYVKRVNINQAVLVPEEVIKLHACAERKSDFAGEPNIDYFLEERKELSAVIGTVLHSQLQWLSEQYNESFILPNNWHEITRSQLLSSHHFKTDSELDLAVEKVITGLNNTLNDEFGRLILSASNNAASELVLHKKLEQGSVLTRIIDRTFIHQGKRWIIDYKSSQPENGESLTDFVEREKQVYFLQLTDYFKMFVKLGNEPVIAGLYFPMISHFETVLEN